MVLARMALADRLNREWELLSERPAPTWWSRHPQLGGLPDLAAVLGAIRGRPDEILGALVAECLEGDQLAGRVVMQALLPKLVRLACADTRVAFDDYVAAFWCCLRTYPLARRPERVAANLAWETRRLALSELSPKTIPMAEPPPRAPEAPRGPTALGVLAVARARGFLDGRSCQFLNTVYAQGLSSAAAAGVHRVSRTAVRWHCSQGVRRLRQHRQQLLEDLQET